MQTIRREHGSITPKKFSYSAPAIFYLTIDDFKLLHPLAKIGFGFRWAVGKRCILLVISPKRLLFWIRSAGLKGESPRQDRDTHSQEAWHSPLKKHFP